jgi:protocatechuate 3,4-dioxygenase alpha subunit
MPDHAAHLVATPGQTIGPFFHDALPYAGDAYLVAAGRADAIRLTGIVYDGAGTPIPDALIEIWQAAPDGTVPRAEGSLHRDGWTFTGWGRCPTDRSGRYTFTTVTPGAVAGSTARWFAVVVFARGLLNRLFTRCYRPGDGLDDDPLLATVDADRRSTLIATADDDGFVFDIHLQDNPVGSETVFLRFPAHLD